MSGFSPDQAGAEVRVSPNFGPRVGVARPDMIILHYTGMKTGEGAEAWLCAPESQVSSHYLVHEDGRIVQMVRESDRAWHAGKSFWAGVTDVNSHSIGIEIVNPGHEFGYRPFPARQIASVIDLCRGITARHPIPPQRVLAHSDVAPGRKVDPGERFPWRQLADAGVGHFVAPARAGGKPLLAPGSSGSAVEKLQSMLSLYGYGIEITALFDQQTSTLVSAFQRHFRPRRVDGLADRSTLDTLSRLLEALPDMST
ncbi:MAG: N-acetylmuramoyl-L-alanine amidase [Mesorhizobium sp.]|nr:N-acetylmuramoyl-L-alanine amidase [Mesorhizobium sp.]MBL8575843.1 N-acetylmuramoyl-L-alanine amidase [Mesorhizobium sp.]